jgi:ABC-type microcin C transport system duplicated ATPase subunit YejF
MGISFATQQPVTHLLLADLYAFPTQWLGLMLLILFAIAMALACQPKVLLADEPTTALERRMRSLRRSLQMIYQDPYESDDPRFRSGKRSRSRCRCTGSAPRSRSGRS